MIILSNRGLFQYLIIRLDNSIIAILKDLLLVLVFIPWYFLNHLNILYHQFMVLDDEVT